MGHGGYSSVSRSVRTEKLGYHTKSAREIFTETTINTEMSPHGVTQREFRDSDDHPCSIPIGLGLDTTGSMGSVPHFLVKDGNGLPHMMDEIIKAGIPDPQVLFMGIGDHECDRAPLQVGQAESSDPLLDHWLTKLFIEGGGGGNAGESYLLAWFFARYMVTDHFEKRGKKGLLFTIGDEPTLKHLPAHVQKALMGDGQYSDVTSVELLDMAREKFEVFHLHICETGSGSRRHVQDGWKQLLGENAIMIQRKEDVAKTIAQKVVEVVAAQNSGTTQSPAPGPQDVQKKDDGDDADGSDDSMMM